METWPEIQDCAPPDLRMRVDAQCLLASTCAALQQWLVGAGCPEPLVIDGELGLATTRAIAWAYRDPDRVAALTAWLTPTSL